MLRGHGASAGDRVSAGICRGAAQPHCSVTRRPASAAVRMMKHTRSPAHTRSRMRSRGIDHASHSAVLYMAAVQLSYIWLRLSQDAVGAAAAGCALADGFSMTCVWVTCTPLVRPLPSLAPGAEADARAAVKLFLISCSFPYDERQRSRALFMTTAEACALTSVCMDIHTPVGWRWLD